jgi:hypothetical protein
MRPKRAGPARGFSWQTSPQTRKRGRRAGFTREPARACRNTSGNRGWGTAPSASSAGCRRPVAASQGGGCPPPEPGKSRGRGTHPTPHERLTPAIAERGSPAIVDRVSPAIDDWRTSAIDDRVSPAIDDWGTSAIDDRVSPAIADWGTSAIGDCVSPASNDCLSAERGLPRVSVRRTTISVIPLDHPRWAGSGQIRTCRSSGIAPPRSRNATRSCSPIDLKLPSAVAQYPPPVVRPAIRIERQDFALDTRPAPASSRDGDAFFSVCHGCADQQALRAYQAPTPLPMTHLHALPTASNITGSPVALRRPRFGRRVTADHGNTPWHPTSRRCTSSPCCEPAKALDAGHLLPSSDTV